jgi:hypothetical protein
MTTPEMGMGKRIDKLNDYIETGFVTVQAAVEALPKEKKVGWDKLNELFISLVRREKLMENCILGMMAM